MSLYLDIETDYENRISVIGLYERSIGFVQLVGDRVTYQRLVRALPEVDNLFTFNGNSFDLPRIRKQLRLDLHQRFDSIDLRWECYRVGWTGGQKAIEAKLGIRRNLPGLDGRRAQLLWYRFKKRGDEDALQKLLLYNREDIMNMIRIRVVLRQKGSLR